MTSAPFRMPTTWPQPYDPAAAERLIERFAELGRAEARLAARPAVAAMLAALGGNSPYLSDLALREAAALQTILRAGPDRAVADAMADLAAIAPSARRPVVAAGLRRAKRVVALATAIADIGGIWHLDRVTGVLTTLAETTLRLAVAHLLRAAHDRGELALPEPDDPAQGGGFVAIGMGKLGARELNYSSDIDLVLLYDPAAPIYTPQIAVEAIGGFTSRLARDLVTLMEARDADGYVFRTDLRLRPDPAATPPAITLPAALSYYESMGQNWERAAMIKARPVAGDLALGTFFLDAIRPFIWRKGLDFAAVADIQAMKRRIDQHALSKRAGSKPAGSQLAAARGAGAPARGQDPVARIAGHNVKLGEGGIREIEFLAQTLQLVWGGRDPTLRVATTLDALRQLVRTGHLQRRAATELARAYHYLRKVEHRLQMVADRQTHVLPDTPEGLAQFATFMGHADAQGFAVELLGHMDQVGQRYAEVFGDIPDDAYGADVSSALDFSGVDEVPPETAAILAGLGYANIPALVAAVRGWLAGRPRALRSERARDLMAQLLPAVLAALGRQPQPDTAFSRFDALLTRIPAGVQLLSLFQRNPQLLDRIAAVLGAAPWLADHLTRHPAALDGLLSPEEEPDPARLLRLRLRDATALEEVIEIIRRMVREEEFALAVATMDGRLDADSAGLQRTALADAVLSALLAPVLADFASRFGRVRGGGMAVVAMGKAGGREMMAGSDLDLMLIYDHPDDVTESRGGANVKRLPASQWFVRAAHTYIAAVTAPGIDGPLYAVDMRLRPSGNKGPVAVSLKSFRHYHATSAWTWERMALTRARVIAGPPALRAEIEAGIEEAIAHAGEPARIRADAAAMRARLARDLPPIGRWDVKLRPGGQIEVEFVSQTLQLVHAARHPEVRSETTRVALRRLADAGMLPGEDAATLIRADRVWRTVQGMLRITLGRGAHGDLPEATASSLLRAAARAGAPAVDLADLLMTLDGLGREVRALFVRHVGEIADERSGRRPGPGLRDARERRAQRQPEGAEGQAVRAVFLPQGRHARLHQGGLRLPGGPAAARQDRGRGDRRVARQDEADREIRREIQPDLPARLRRGRRCVYRLRHLGGEIHVRPEIHGHGAQHLPDRQERQDRQNLAQGQRSRPRQGSDGRGRRAVAAREIFPVGCLRIVRPGGRKHDQPSDRHKSDGRKSDGRNAPGNRGQARRIPRRSRESGIGLAQPRQPVRKVEPRQQAQRHDPEAGDRDPFGRAGTEGDIQVRRQHAPGIDPRGQRVPGEFDARRQQPRRRRQQGQDPWRRPPLRRQRPPQHQPNEQPCRQRRGRNPGLGLQEVMPQHQHADAVDRHVQPLPAPAHAAHGGIGGGRAQRDQSGQRGEADGQVEPAHDLHRHFQQMEVHVDHVQADMRQRVRHRGDAEHAPHQHDPWVVEHHARRRHRQRQQHEAQRPEAGQMDRRIDRARAEIAVPPPIADQQRRDARADQNQ